MIFFFFMEISVLSTIDSLYGVKIKKLRSGQDRLVCRKQPCEEEKGGGKRGYEKEVKEGENEDNIVYSTNLELIE